MYVLILLQLLLEVFLILRRMQRDIIIMYIYRASCEVPVVIATF